MNWRWKQAGMAGALACSVLLLVSLASSRVLLDGFERVENESVQQVAGGARLAFEQRISGLGEKFAEWGAWDDMYRFAAPPLARATAVQHARQQRELKAYRAAFVRSNLAPPSLALLRVNLFAIVGLDGRLLWGTSFDGATNRTGPLPEAILARLRPGDRLLRSRSGALTQGLIELPSGLSIVAALPIVRSDRTGPTRGFLIAGRPLNAGEWSRLRAGTGLDLSFLPLPRAEASRTEAAASELASEAALSREERAMLPLLARAFHGDEAARDAGVVVVAPLSEEKVAGFSSLRDLDGRLLGALRLVQPRALRQQGLSTLRIFHLVLWSLGLGALGLSMWALRRSEARFRALVQNGWDIVAILRPDLSGLTLAQVLAGRARPPQPPRRSPQVVYISPGVARILGYPPREVENTSASLWIHPQDRDRALERLSHWMQAAEGARLEAMSCRWRHRDGSWRDLEMTGAHWPRDPDIAGLVLNARDVSEQKRAQERVLAEATRFSSLLQATPEAVLIADAHSRIVASNPAAQQLFGYPEHELLGQSMGRLLPLHPAHHQNGAPSALEVKPSEMEGAVPGVEIGAMEVMARRSDGSEFAAELSLARWRSKDEAGEDAAFTAGILRDISRRRQGEARLAESTRRVEASLREKEVLLKEIHHRVKNNMQVISSILSLQASMLDDASVRAALRETQGRIKSMSLIHEKLYRSDDLGRVDFGDYLRGLAQGLLRSHPPRGSRRPARLQLELEPIRLSIDQAAPAGLLVNELLTNALKHAFQDFDSEPGPDAAPPLLSVRLSRGEQAQVEVEVEDNGRGMDPAFDWRASESLGLQLVSTLAEQLEGRVEPSSGEPRGTRWRLRFPQHEEAATAQAAAQRPL